MLLNEKENTSTNRNINAKFFSYDLLGAEFDKLASEFTTQMPNFKLA